MAFYYNTYNGMSWNGIFLEFFGSFWPASAFVMLVAFSSAISRYDRYYLYVIICALCLIQYMLFFNYFAEMKFTFLVENGDAFRGTDDGGNVGNGRKWSGPQKKPNVSIEFAKAGLSYFILFLGTFSFTKLAISKLNIKRLLNNAPNS